MADIPAASEFTQRPKFNAPFPEQVEFFRKKLNLPTERWDDILRSAHDRAFVVAGAQSADLLADLHQAVSKAITEGTGLEAFRKDFKNIVAKNGWTGFTGSGSKAGIAWRTKVIYQTNLATSYAAGRWQQLNDPDLLKALPYWRYKHNDSVLSPRPLHLSWDGLTLPAQHAFWRTHFPPNGWGCQCRVVPVNKTEFMQAVVDGRGPADAPAAGDTTGIDDGFGYAPGAGIDVPLRQLVQDKLINYPPAISRALSKDINRRIDAAKSLIDFVEQSLSDRKFFDNALLGFVEPSDSVNKIAGTDLQGYIALLKAEAVRHVDNSHGNDTGDQRPPTPKDFSELINVLNDADKLSAGETTRNGNRTIIAQKKIGKEIFRSIFEVRPGKSNKALYLLSFLIKQ